MDENISCIIAATFDFTFFFSDQQKLPGEEFKREWEQSQGNGSTEDGYIMNSWLYLWCGISLHAGISLHMCLLFVGIFTKWYRMLEKKAIAVTLSINQSGK